MYYEHDYRREVTLTPNNLGEVWNIQKRDNVEVVSSIGLQL